MTVQRYRDVADMPPPERADPRDPSTWSRIRAVWGVANRLPPLFPPGLYRYRSVEESDVAREAATIARMRVLRERRTAGPGEPGAREPTTT